MLAHSAKSSQKMNAFDEEEEPKKRRT